MFCDDKACSYGQFAGRQVQSFSGETFFYAGHFHDDMASLYLGYIEFNIAFACAHRHFRGFPCDRLVGKYSDPDFSSALQAVGRGFAGRFQLSGVYFAAGCRFDSKRAERELGAGCRDAVFAMPHPVPFSVFGLFGLKHG